jgi:GNAT superfamily N-acetyltransferase
MKDLHDQIFDLYRETFPANERRPESDLRAAMITPEYRVLNRLSAGRLLGFAFLFVPTNEDFALVEYLAVHPASRGRGVGTQLIQSAIDQSLGKTLITEVESQSSNPNSLRRQVFYRRAGFTPITGLKYQLPLGGNPPPMELWVYHSAESAQFAQLAHWIRTIYLRVYGCAADDPRIGQMLQFPIS